ncbi:plasmid partition protein ParG [Pseudomonas sp. p106]|uniref:plasmid partition protein ParG n=1 Tax=Pseudomonas sp. p106 TaxID=2479854 RepID=UPI00131590E8|nr:plasmid partition protein ParG [Pseudomonas sp. p106]
MNIIIKSVEHDSEDGINFIVVEFFVDGDYYRHALEDERFLDRSSLDLDSDTLDAVQQALYAFIDAHAVSTELYDIDDLSHQAKLLGYRLGTRYVLDQLGETVQLVEVTDRYRKMVISFNDRPECAFWLRGQLADPLLEEGPVKRVNANIPKPLHDDFKAMCVRRGVDMQDVLTELIIGWMK